MDNTNENMTEDKDINKNNNVNSDDYEKICFVCRRPESRAGKMIVMPNNIYICQDCMQRTFDSINSSGINYEDMMKMSNMPGMGMFGNFGVMDSDPVPEKQKLKKKKEDKKELPALDVSKLPAPHEIKKKLDEYVIGQDYAKKVMSVAVYNHYKRVSADAKILGDVEIEKSNMLMIGPTGSGKTYLVKTLARILQVPLAITDATTLTEAGYIGDDIESVVSKLLLAADNDVEKAEHGIIFIDEIDKIAKKKETRSRDVSGESVQQGMLKLLEGSEVEVPVGATSKNAMVPQVTVNTKDILFICGGAFPDLEDIIKTRLNKSSSMGFNADLKDKYDDEKNIMSYVTVDDLREYGMIPEFLGRLPIIYSLDRLDEDMLVNILKEPKNAILKQYQKLLELDEVKLEFTDDALRSIARKAMEKEKTRTDYFDRKINREVYFSAVADNLLGEEGSAWGLISARMGRKSYVAEVLESCVFARKNDDSNKVTLDLARVDSISWNEAIEKFNIAKKKVLSLRKDIKNDQKLLVDFYQEKKNLAKRKWELKQLTIEKEQLNKPLNEVKTELENNEKETLEQEEEISNRWSS